MGCPEAIAVLDILLLNFCRSGPSPSGYKVKTLGHKLGGLWQINLKVEKRQVRVLYAPYGLAIVLFRIHKKSSPQEQTRAYELAMQRKRDYEFERKKAELVSNDGSRTSH
jgi:hypothetical protein